MLLRACLFVFVPAALALLPPPVLANEPQPALQADSTALFVMPINAPRWVPADDGQVHVEYDLLIANSFSAPASITVVEEMDPTGRVLGYKTALDLTAAIRTMTGKQALAAIPAGGTAVLAIDLALKPGDLPEHVTHRIAYEIPGAPDSARAGIAHYEIEGPQVTLQPAPPLTIHPPVQGEHWLARNACCAPDERNNARVAAAMRIAAPGLFALDYVRLRDGRLASDDGAQNEQYAAFGAPVRAVADGPVVAAHDGTEDNVPLKPVTTLHQPVDFAGNFVLQRIGPKAYAYYAHLKKGSVSVKVGDTLKTGAPLGAVGASGDTTIPRLHFALLDRPDFTTGNALPFVYPSYTLTGRFTARDLEDGGPQIEPLSQAVSTAYPLAGGIATYE